MSAADVLVAVVTGVLGIGVPIGITYHLGNLFNALFERWGRHGR